MMTTPPIEAAMAMSTVNVVLFVLAAADWIWGAAAVDSASTDAVRVIVDFGPADSAGPTALRFKESEVWGGAGGGVELVHLQQPR